MAQLCIPKGLLTDGKEPPDRDLVRLARPALEARRPVRIDLTITNVRRTIGTRLSHEIAKYWGEAGLPDDTIVIQASGSAVNEVLKDESWGSSGFRVGKLSKGLVVGEIALSLGVLVAAGLMIKSVTNLNTIDYGFDTETTFTARMGLFEADYPDTTSRREFYREVLRRVEVGRDQLAVVRGGRRAQLAGEPLPQLETER